MAALASYKDPGYRDLANAVTADLGLPEDVLYSIITKGEKSNADQVSSSGARTVAQIIPATRKAILDRHGVDAYLSPENAVRAAGLILKDNLDRAKGDVREAVTQYVAGTGGERGPVTRAYVNRVLGAEPRAKPAAPVAPSRVVEAFNSGQMTATQAADFKKALSAGQFSLPEGAKLNDRVTVKPNEGAAVIPKRVIDNYTNRSDMTDAQRDLIDRDIAAGTLRLPDGVKLARPAELSAGQKFGMGVRDIPEALGGLADALIVNPALATFNAGVRLTGAPMALAMDNGRLGLTGNKDAGYSPTTAGAQAAGDAAGLARPETSSEKMVSAINQGAVQGLATAGSASALAGLPGAAGRVAQTLAAAPILDTVSSAASTGASELARQNGGGPVGEIAAGLAGAIAPVGLAKAAERVAVRFGSKVAKVVAEVPREVVLDEAGKLTDEGVEVAARQGVAADDLAAAYDEAATEPAAPTAGGKPESLPNAEFQHNVQANRPGESSGAIHLFDPETYERYGTIEYQAVRGEPPEIRNIDVPEEFRRQGVATSLVEKLRAEVGEPTWSATTEDGAALKSALDGAAPKAAPSPEAVTPPPTPDAPLPATAAARVDEAQSLGVDLTRGQATNDSTMQAADQDLAGIHSPEGKVVQEHFDNQKVRIKTVADELQAKLGDRTLTATERGQAVKDGLNDLFEQGRAGVNAAYKQLEKMVEGLKGKVSPEALNVETNALREKVLDLLADNKARPEMQKGLAEIAARYGITGENAVFVPSTGMTKVQFRDADNNLVPGIAFRGKVEPLSLTNSEKMRQDISALYDRVSGKNPQELLNPMIDDAVTEASERLARMGDNGGPPLDDDARVGAQALAAREAHKGVQNTFKGGDVIDRLIARKRGTRIDAVKPEEVFAIINGKGAEALTNIRKLKSVMMGSGPDKLATDASRAGWRAVQAQAVSDIIQKATVRNTNLGDLGFGKISGAKLNGAVHDFGIEKLKIILDPEDFEQFMKIRRVAMNTDIPLPNTYNASGSGHVVARLMGRMATKFMSIAGAAAGAAVGGPVGAAMGGSAGAVVDNIVSAAKSASAAKNTVENVTNFTAEKAAKIESPSPKETVPLGQAISDFVNLASGDRLLAPALANLSSGGNDDARSGQQPATQEPSSER